MDVVFEAGSRFAVPAQTTYVKADPGLDVERVDAAEALVQEWRDRGELYLPQFPPAIVESLCGTLSYPLEGSARTGDCDEDRPNKK